MRLQGVYMPTELPWIVLTLACKTLTLSLLIIMQDGGKYESKYKGVGCTDFC